MCTVPNIWLRPPNRQKEADAAKATFIVPGGDHLTLLNAYNLYIRSMSPAFLNLDCGHSYPSQINTTGTGAGGISSRSV